MKLVVVAGLEGREAVRALLRGGLDRGDRVCVLAWKGRLEAYGEVKGLLEGYFPGEVELRLVELPKEDFALAVGAARRAFEELGRGASEASFILGGDAGLTAVALAALGLAELGVKPSVEVDGLEAPAELFVVSVKGRVYGARRRVLEALAEAGEAEVEELASRLGLDKSTVRRHLAALEELGLVEVYGSRPVKARLKPWARALV